MANIEIKNVSKSYGKSLALENVSVTFEKNKIYGLLGRNGAGKTTLLNLITNRIFPTDGTILVDGENVRENDNALEKICFMTEQALYPENMKVKDIFTWTKEFYPLFNEEYAYKLAEKFQLNVNKKFKSLSTGYSSITKLITVLASEAEVLIFDEPVLGLDANHRELFYRELMENYIKSPKTMILSTHIIEEVSELLEDVVIIKDKKVITNEEVEEMLSNAYTVSGLSSNVEKYIDNKKCVNIDVMTSFKSATIIGKLSDEDKEKIKELSLEISKVELQKLFIYLTNKGE